MATEFADAETHHKPASRPYVLKSIVFESVASSFGISGKERRRSRDDVGVSSSNSKSSSKATHSVNGSSGGGTTYAATTTNSASYGAHHTSQYQQYGSRYSGASAPPPSTASYPASGYSQYGSSYYQVWTQTQFFSICLSPTDCVCIYGIKSTESENFSTFLSVFLTSILSHLFNIAEHGAYLFQNDYRSRTRKPNPYINDAAARIFSPAK